MAESRPDWLTSRPDGVELAVHVRPGASSAGIAGLHGEAVCVRVRARPVDGQANRELLDVLAAALGLRPSALEVRRGTRGRDKRVMARGLTAAEVVTRLGPSLR